MSTKKLQIVTPIVTSVNGQTGDVTLDISGGGGSSDIFVVEFTLDNNDNITGVSKTFEETKQAIESNKIVAIQMATNELNPCLDQMFLSGTTGEEGYPFEQILLKFSYMYVFNHTATLSWTKNSSGAEEFETAFDESPVWFSDDSDLSNSGAAYWNASNKEWEIKDITSGSSDALNPIVLTTNSEFHKEGDICSITSPTATEIWDAFNRCDSAFYLRENHPHGGMLQLLLDGGMSSTSGNTDHEIAFKELRGFGTRIEMRIFLWQSKNNTLTLRTIIESQYKAGNGISISDDGTISVTAAKIYSGTSNTPSADLGENGDIYIQTEG